MTPELAIPARLNEALVVLVAATMAGLLVLAAQLSGWPLLAVAVVFSFVFQTNYALLHESSHRTLHPLPAVNDGLGVVAGLLFPTSATMMRVTHEVHHRCNRTDHEMFDCYYPGDNRVVKVAQWYAILTGCFYLIIPPGCLIVGFLRPLLLTRPFKRSRSASVLYDDFTGATLRRVRWEALLVVAAWGAALGSGLLAWGPTLLLYGAAAFNWGSRQYVTHAWSPRRIMDGAHNLATNRVHRWLLLNGTWDEAHHREPRVPWIHLPALGRECRAPIPYLTQWLSQWRGPRPAREPDPRRAPVPPAAAPAA